MRARRPTMKGTGAVQVGGGGSYGSVQTDFSAILFGWHLHHWHGHHASARRSPPLRHRHRRLMSAGLAQEAEGAGSRLNRQSDEHERAAESGLLCLAHQINQLTRQSKTSARDLFEAERHERSNSCQDRKMHRRLERLHGFGPTPAGSAILY